MKLRSHKLIRYRPISARGNEEARRCDARVLLSASRSDDVGACSIETRFTNFIVVEPEA